MSDVISYCVLGMLFLTTITILIQNIKVKELKNKLKISHSGNDTFMLLSKLFFYLPYLSRDEDISTVLRIYRNMEYGSPVEEFSNRLNVAALEKDTFFCPSEVQDLIIKIFPN